MVFFANFSHTFSSGNFPNFFVLHNPALLLATAEWMREFFVTLDLCNLIEEGHLDLLVSFFSGMFGIEELRG